MKRLETTSGAMKGYTDEADHIDAGGALLFDPPLQFLEHVRRDRLQALGWICDGHGRGNLTEA